MPKGTVSYLDYFPGGVPPGAYFALQVDDITKVLDAVPPPKHDGLDLTAEICLIGLVAHFEAFFRAQFAALINLCPNLVNRLKQRGRDVSVDAIAVLEAGSNPASKIGFLLAEKYDIGTPAAVNTLFGELLKTTPFSADERERYEAILNDRNLLVHHGGIYTTRYSRQVFVKRRAGQRTHFDSLVVTRKLVTDTAAFLN